MTKLSLLFFVLLFSGFVRSQNECPEPSEPTALLVMDLVKQAPMNFTTVDEFLMKLPKTMTSNFIFVADSRSFQTASRKNPRVILSSPNADVRISFNTQAGQRGYNNIEISFWNPKTKKFEYSELAFDAAAARAPKRHGDTACTTCHGNPPKPNWDTNNFWSGIIPFNKDAIVKNSVEESWYKEYLSKIKEKKPGNRLQYLTPLEDAKAIDKGLESKGHIIRQYLSENGPKHSSVGGIATNLFNGLQSRQQCAEQELLKKNQRYEKFKYLLRGIEKKCLNLKSFVPEWFHKAANDYFYGTLDGFTHGDANQEGLFNKNFGKIFKDTENRQLAVRQDKENRQRYFLEKELGSLELSDKEMKHQIEKIGLNSPGISPGVSQANIGEDAKALATYRYFLEPFGASISRFSTSIDPTSYSFANSFGGKYMTPEEIQKIDAELEQRGQKGMDQCEVLAAFSLEAVKEEAIMSSLLSESQDLCNKKIAMNKGVLDLEKMATGLLEVQAGNIFNNRCASCHADKVYNGLDYSVGGAKVFPFKNISQLKNMLLSPQGQLIGWGDKIKDRINRPHNIPGSMPLSGLVQLEEEEKQFLNSWINQFVSPVKKLDQVNLNEKAEK